MAERLSAQAVISYFSGEDGEIVFDGSDDELGMEDEEFDNSEPDYEPLETDEGNYNYDHNKHNERQS